MARQTIQGYAVIGRKFLSKGKEVHGIGAGACEAWSDAAYKLTLGRVPSRDLKKEFPDLQCVDAKITVTF